MSEQARKSAKSSETRFVCDAGPKAQKVYLVGDFNDWQPGADRMTKSNGKFVKRMALPPGEYQYKFVIDGEWQADPSAAVQAQNDFGTTNSVISV